MTLHTSSWKALMLNDRCVQANVQNWFPSIKERTKNWNTEFVHTSFEFNARVLHFIDSTHFCKLVFFFSFIAFTFNNILIRLGYLFFFFVRLFFCSNSLCFHHLWAERSNYKSALDTFAMIAMSKSIFNQPMNSSIKCSQNCYRKQFNLLFSFKLILLWFFGFFRRYGTSIFSFVMLVIRESITSQTQHHLNINEKQKLTNIRFKCQLEVSWTKKLYFFKNYPQSDHRSVCFSDNNNELILRIFPQF